MEMQTNRLRALGELEDVREEIRASVRTLTELDRWRPAAGLRKSCEEALAMLDRLSERFDRKLVVTLVGPCGSGKSTLLNALAGQDDLSAVSHRRPTTQHVVAFCRHRDDVRQLEERLGTDAIRVHASDAADALENLILIDTPDTDSTQQERHIPIVHEAIRLSDVLICVFDAENPKRRDHTDFLAPYVRLFSGRSLVVAVNKADRLADRELIETVMPEFERYIREAWSVEPAAMVCISARSRLKAPQWDPLATPRHNHNQFDQLRDLIVQTFNRAGYSVDRRLENARQVRDYLHGRIGTLAHRQKAPLEAALAQMAAADTEGLRQALTAFRSDGAALTAGLNVRLYQQLAQRWLGPVGWLVALWARILVFGTGLAALLRIGSPLRQVAGAVAAVRHYADTHQKVAAVDRGVGATTALIRYRGAIARSWPDIAEMLVGAGFVDAIRETRQAPGHEVPIDQHLSQQWGEALEAELARTGRRLSGGLLQLLFNLPVVAVLGYTGWLTVMNFFSGTILSGDFFLHAFWTIALVLLLCFFLLQGLVRLTAGKDRLLERVFTQVREAVDQSGNLNDSPVWRQAQTILGLAAHRSAAATGDRRFPV